MPWHGTLHPCYGVLNIKGHNELHTHGRAPDMRWHGTLHPCYGIFNIKGHNELHTQGGASRYALAWDIAPMLWCF